MKGGTLIVSRANKVYDYIQNEYDKMGYKNITITGVERDGLNNIIYDMKPDILFMGCKFFQCCTPFMIKGLRKDFPNLNIVAISVTDFPADLWMYFIINGANSYVNFYEGFKQFHNGMDIIRKGKDFVSDEIKERIACRANRPKPSGKITDIHIEVMRALCNGFTTEEIARNLCIAVSTVENHKTEIYQSLNLRNDREIIRAALSLGYVTTDELVFFGNNFVTNPKPLKEKPHRGKK